VVKDSIGAELLNGVQVVSEVLDLGWKHGADGKDPAHAQCLMWIPDRQHFVTHGLSS
jgi:hypothetical protein